MAENSSKDNVLAELGYNQDSFADAMKKKKLDKLRNGHGPQAKRIRAYEDIVDLEGNTSLYDIAANVGRDVNKVADDLEEMIKEGFFESAYVDRGNMLIVMTRDGQAIEDVAASAAASKKARGEAPDSIADLILVTDDEEIKAKLQALQELIDKIDERAAEYPKLEKDVKEYNDVFFPAVVRLTDAYNGKIAKLEEATEIKAELIKLIDNVIEASENLLDRLREDEIMDITTDIRAIQTKIASEGLLDSDFDITL